MRTAWPPHQQGVTSSSEVQQTLRGDAVPVSRAYSVGIASEGKESGPAKYRVQIPPLTSTLSVKASTQIRQAFLGRSCFYDSQLPWRPSTLAPIFPLGSRIRPWRAPPPSEYSTPPNCQFPARLHSLFNLFCRVTRAACQLMSPEAVMGITGEG
ncbi:hypothetical protein P154DRAFT_239708 [Amniculicola lignicola CBS 123094]|uniref:Uncharacterized protein n=1 Tax=Amniculicola lignicola CBS 123094 TaxID=1392246 RepID=A0A6A5WDT5_9PLEO|nr:hypothetical protein P154DRAFT_239708 [Amniculicola lignicola CBS 123094]